MNFANYGAFRVAIQQLIEGDDITGTFSLGTIDLIVGLAENRVYRDLRASTMLSSMTLTPVSNVVTLPADLIELKEIYTTTDTTKPFEIIPLERLRKFLTNPTGTTRYAAQDGDTLQFWPQQTTTVTGKYYARPVDLKSITWANATTFVRYPEVFIFACLAEAMQFLGFDDRVTLFETRYMVALKDAIREEHLRVYGGSRMTVRAR